MSLPHSKIKSRLAYLERNDYPVPDANPDGDYWRIGTQALNQQLTDLIGRQQYEVFAELVWPGETIDDKTWKEIYKQLDAALDQAYQGERDVIKLADAALYPEQSAPGCYGL